MVTATTYFLSRTPSKYSSLPQVENASEQAAADLPFFAPRLGLKTTGWLSSVAVCLVALASSFVILSNNRLILTPSIGAFATMFLVAQTVVYLLLPQLLKAQLLPTQDEEDPKQLDWQGVSGLAGRVFGLLTIYLAISPGSSIISPILLASSLVILIKWVSTILLVSRPSLLSWNR
jgi:hypothetical protein